MIWRALLVPSVLLVAAPSLFAITNPNHSFSKLIAKPHLENTLNAFGEWAQNKNAKHVPQSVAEPFNWQRAGTTALHCVTITAQGVPGTVKYVAESAVESFNQGEPQRALGGFVSASQGLAQEAHLAFNRHLQSTLAGLQQRQ